MQSRLRDFLVGIVSMVALAGFAILLLLFGELATLWQRRYPVAVHADTSAGLRVGSQVTINGVVVGSISAIELELTDRDYPVRITALVDEKIDVPLDAKPSVGLSLLGGGQRLDLHMPADGPKDGAVASRTSISVIHGSFDTLNDLIDGMKLALEDARGVLAKLDGVFGGADGAMSKVDGLVDSAQGAFGDISRAAKQAEQTLAKAHVWLDDEQLREDLRGTLFNARQSTATIGRILDGMERDAPAFLASLTRASDQLSVSLQQLDTLLRQAREGQGTVGRLMSNPDLYNNLNDAALRLTNVLRQAQLLLEKIKQEGLDVKF